MVVRMSQFCAERVLMLIALAMLALAISATAATTGNAALPDPTRPPDSVIAASNAAPGEIAAFAEPQLQSVLIGTNGRSAIIGGQRYRLGDRVGDATLVKISEAEVVLAGAGGRRTMSLFPAVKKRVDTPAAKVPRRATQRTADRASARNAESKADSGIGIDTGRGAALNSSRSP
jgi:MSHA biogenesis protein MshK